MRGYPLEGTCGDGTLVVRIGNRGGAAYDAGVSIFFPQSGDPLDFYFTGGSECEP